MLQKQWIGKRPKEHRDRQAAFPRVGLFHAQFDLDRRLGDFFGRDEPAQSCLFLGLAAQPDLQQAHVQLGIALVRRGVPTEATVALREGLRLDPLDADATFYLGEALHAQGDLKEALGMLQRAAELSPDHPRSYMLLGRLLDRIGLAEEAMAMHKKAREVATK